MISEHVIRWSLKGVTVDNLSIDELSDYALNMIDDQVVISNHNLHSLALRLKLNSKMDDFYNLPGICHLDGFGGLFFLRMLGAPLLKEHRTTYADWFPKLIQLASSNHLRLAYIGGTENTVLRANERLKREFPQLDVWLHHGYFDQTTNSPGSLCIMHSLREFNPDWIFLGLGMPRQEQWLVSHWPLAPIKGVWFQAGAALDFWAGTVPTPPRWMGRNGLEWLHRLYNNPRRLAYRYLVEPLFLVPWWMAAQVARCKGRSKRTRYTNVLSLRP